MLLSTGKGRREGIIKALDLNEPKLFLDSVGYFYYDAPATMDEMDCYLDRYKFHFESIRNERIAKHLALLDTFNKIVYR